jgi:apoptosis-inducing factor 2
MSTYVTRELQNLKVNLKLKTKVKTSAQLPNGQYELTLSSGEKLVTDMYIPTFGLMPNSSYFPSEFLDAKGYVIVDSYLQVLGAKDVWAIGDVSACEWSQLIPADKQSAHLAKNIVLLLNNKQPLPYKLITHRKSIFCSRHLVDWRSANIVIVGVTGIQIGKKAGIGHFGSWTIPSFVIVYVRRMLFMEQMEGWLNGSGI